jgi:hypothetical protein
LSVVGNSLLILALFLSLPGFATLARTVRQPVKKGVQYCHKFTIFAMLVPNGNLYTKPLFRQDLSGAEPVA